MTNAQVQQSSTPPEEFIVVLVTAGTEEEAAKIATVAVEEKLAACVNVIAPIRSIYRWEDKVTQELESLLVIKTTRRRYPALEERIRSLHSYQTPEIIALQMMTGLPSYLKWVSDTTK